MFIEWASFVVIGVAALVAAASLGSTSQLRVIRNLLIAGALMRIVGVLARHTMIFDLYDGGSDAVGYFEAGRIIADHFRSLDFSIIGSGRWGDREWGTQGIRYAAGLVLTFVGPSVRGTFLVFSLAAFAGLICTAVAFARLTRLRFDAARGPADLSVADIVVLAVEHRQRGRAASGGWPGDDRLCRTRRAHSLVRDWRTGLASRDGDSTPPCGGYGGVGLRGRMDASRMDVRAHDRRRCSRARSPSGWSSRHSTFSV